MVFSSPSTISNFRLYSGAGNSFVLGETSLSPEEICVLCAETRTDGYLLIQPSSLADAKMVIFNSDGSRPSMCGNGLRCAIAHVAEAQRKQHISMETDSGVYQGIFYSWDRIVVDMTLDDWQLSLFQLDHGLAFLPRSVGFAHTGVPHLVLFVPDVSSVDVSACGRLLRFHQHFSPDGVNVNFAEVLSPGRLLVRTYERGLERESLACGTGATAVALIAAQVYQWEASAIDICTWGKERLRVSWSAGRTFLEGSVKINI